MLTIAVAVVVVVIVIRRCHCHCLKEEKFTSWPHSMGTFSDFINFWTRSFLHSYIIAFDWTVTHRRITLRLLDSSCSPFSRSLCSSICLKYGPLSLSLSLSHFRKFLFCKHLVCIYCWLVEKVWPLDFCGGFLNLRSCSEPPLPPSPPIQLWWITLNLDSRHKWGWSEQKKFSLFQVWTLQFAVIWLWLFTNLQLFTFQLNISRICRLPFIQSGYLNLFQSDAKMNFALLFLAFSFTSFCFFFCFSLNRFPL